MYVRVGSSLGFHIDEDKGIGFFEIVVNGKSIMLEAVYELMIWANLETYISMVETIQIIEKKTNKLECALKNPEGA